MGQYRHFERGSIHWHPDTGAFETHGKIRDVWSHMEWEGGKLGYPVSDEMDWDAKDFPIGDNQPESMVVGRCNRFQGGALLWPWDGPQAFLYEFGTSSAVPVCLPGDAPVDSYANHYSDEGFWKKLAGYAKAAGKELIEKALILYYAYQDPAVPTWAKTIIVGALGYLICPIDLIPDAIPVIGFTDDLGVIIAALAAIAVHVTDETKRKAADKTRELFGD